jgi:hypothetical protein
MGVATARIRTMQGATTPNATSQGAKHTKEFAYNKRVVGEFRSVLNS